MRDQLEVHAYYLALAQSPIVFAMAGAPEHILHGLPASYYHLLLLGRFSGLAALGDADVRRLRDADFKAMLGPSHAGVADVRGPPDDDSDDGRLALDPAAPPPPAAPALPPAHPALIPYPVAPAPVARDVSGRSLVVNFDGFSHQSGNLRAFITCKDPRHQHDRAGGCRRYVFVKNHGPRERAAAWLFEWASLAERYPNGTDHVDNDPDDALVDAISREHF